MADISTPRPIWQEALGLVMVMLAGAGSAVIVCIVATSILE